MPTPVLNLTEAEAIDYIGLPKEVILKRYIKTHKDDRCPHCKRLIGNHSTKQLSRCADTDGLVVKVNKLEIDPPVEVKMVLCSSCNRYAPPTSKCIWCSEDLTVVKK